MASGRHGPGTTDDIGLSRPTLSDAVAIVAANSQILFSPALRAVRDIGRTVRALLMTAQAGHAS